MKKPAYATASQPEPLAMTREDALAVFRLGPDAVADVLLGMDERIRAQDARIAKLEGMMAKNSRNSSKPPSSDGLAKPAPKSLRKKSGRKPGGQQGHPGGTLERRKNPDVVEAHRVDRCEKCGCDLRNEKAQGMEQRQVFDIPPVELLVTEHQAEVKQCACGHTTTAAFPEGVVAPVQYGPCIKATAIYLNGYQLLPYARLCETLRDLFNTPLSEGTLANMVRQAGRLAQGSVDGIRDALGAAAVVHFDETGMRRNGKTNWMHCASTPTMSLFTLHNRRGMEAMDAAGVLPGFAGTAVHDYWKSYYHYKCSHALCNAHHLRDLTYIHEQMEQPWAEEAIGTLLSIKEGVEAAKAAGSAALAPDTLRDFEQRWQQVLDQGYAANPDPPPPKKKKRGPPAKGKARNLVERFDHRRREVLAFMHDFDIPFDNNLAERDLRMNKVKQKISGCFRDTGHSEDFCRIRSYICTARKNTTGAFEALSGLFQAHPAMSAAPE
ncbi:IS66 family transposase [Pontiella sulfatireligans]|nr:IS66 family transposase [Pontiella sulfatireligans]